MEWLVPILEQILRPQIMFFALGILAVIAKSDLEIPPVMFKAMAIFLLVSIGLEGGVELVEALVVAPGLLGVAVIVAIWAAVLGIIIAILTAIIFIKNGMKTADAWACGGHYGAVSTATFIIGVTIAEGIEGALPGGPWMVAINPFMDSSGVIIAIILGRMALAREAGVTTTLDKKQLVWETITGMAPWLIIGSLVLGLIGQTYSPNEIEDAMVFFDDMFDGVLCLFMLEIGVAAGRQLGALKELGANLWKFVAMAFLLPQVWGIIGILGIYVVHLLMPGMLGWGDALIFATFAGGCSFISSPAAIRASMPEANPSIYLPMSIALTFPFNVIIGIPLWKIVSMALWGV